MVIFGGNARVYRFPAGAVVVIVIKKILIFRKMKSLFTVFAVTVLMAFSCGGNVRPTVALSFNGNDKTIIDTLAWTSDLSEVNSNYFNINTRSG